jgi:hypothetical protein
VEAEELEASNGSKHEGVCYDVEEVEDGMALALNLCGILSW